jgi:hypothetical protein
MVECQVSEATASGADRSEQRTWASDRVVQIHLQLAFACNVDAKKKKQL